MADRAKNLGANAVIGHLTLDSQVMPLDKSKFASGVVCVGTAIVAKHKKFVLRLAPNHRHSQSAPFWGHPF